MEYTINKLAKLAGISTRTLRWYDECGLLKPHRINSNGYRIYGQSEIDRLQQILFYRELGVELSEIGHILAAKEFDGLVAMQKHYDALCAKQKQLSSLIANVEKSIKAMKGEINMSDHEKFEGFKQNLINDNEQKYGDEIRTKYGNDVVNRSNAKIKGMTKAQYAEVEALSQQLNETLKAAFEQGDPSSELAQKACELHKRWLCYYWDEYSKEAHMGVVQMYVDDERFAAYYDKIAPVSSFASQNQPSAAGHLSGTRCAVFLRDAVRVYCDEPKNV
ncbi:MAG: MerR family transcriptional regulator [Defluviitaleaceae bacterium]|nr:MerR family transcriptional regulator [Defluviitaleaceae bacterium]